MQLSPLSSNSKGNHQVWSSYEFELKGYYFRLYLLARELRKGWVIRWNELCMQSRVNRGDLDLHEICEFNFSPKERKKKKTQNLACTKIKKKKKTEYLTRGYRYWTIRFAATRATYSNWIWFCFLRNLFLCQTGILHITVSFCQIGVSHRIRQIEYYVEYFPKVQCTIQHVSEFL